MTNGSQSEVNQVLQRIGEVLGARDEARLASAAYDMETAALLSDEVRDSFLEHLALWLRRPEFQQTTGAWRLVYALREDLRYARGNARIDLARAMLDAFSTSLSRTSFVLSELLGELATVEVWGLVVDRLDGGLEPRSLVPHLLEHFVRPGVDANIARRALEQLVGLTSDDVEGVRDAAVTSLRRLIDTLPADLQGVVTTALGRCD